MADWRIRPLPAEMLQYARCDTHFLLFIYDHLRNSLLTQQLVLPDQVDGTSGEILDPPAALREVLDRSAQTSLKLYEREGYDLADGHGSWLSGAKLLVKTKGGENAWAWRALHNWRDGVAREQDESPL